MSGLERGTGPPLCPCRQHNSLHCPLLQLPDAVLPIIAQHMGKISRRLCSELCSVYGSPGAILGPQVATIAPTSRTTPSAPELLAAVQSWRYPADVKLLVELTIGGSAMYRNALLDATTCHTVAEALPALRELRCLGSIAPAPCSSSGGRLGAGIQPHTAITLLQLHGADADLGPIAAFAPNLRVLRFHNFCHLSPLAPAMALEAVLSLQGLQHLELHHFRLSSISTDAFTSAMLHLTALTHLGMTITDGCRAIHAHKALRLTSALASPPLLASIQIMGFRCFGPTLGTALQALRLRHLDLGELAYRLGVLPSLQGCLPSIGSLPRLKSLRLCGKKVIGSEQLWQPSRPSSTSLRALDVGGMQPNTLPVACRLLLHCPMLTKLIITISSTNNATTTHDLQSLHEALSGYTRLQHLEMDAFSKVSWLTRLSQLTCLKLVCPQDGRIHVTDANLRVIKTLTSLRRLEFHGNLQRSASCYLCMTALRCLHLLEEAECTLGKWREADVLSLLPPPSRLRRVLLRSSEPLAHNAPYHRWGVLGRGAIEKFESYGVEVVMA
jgi:hypothetical protein